MVHSAVTEEGQSTDQADIITSIRDSVPLLRMMELKVKLEVAKDA